jgi:hypothetical protein
MSRIRALEDAPPSDAVYRDAVWLWDVLTWPANGTDPGAAPRPWAVERLSSLLADLERCLGRVGELAARPPLSLEAMRSKPALARERPEWSRPPVPLSGAALLAHWRRLAAEGGVMAGAARIRVAQLEAAIQAAERVRLGEYAVEEVKG